MNPGDVVSCIFCLQPDALEVKLDKKGRPFFKCHCCGTMCFIHGRGMAGPSLLFGPLTMALKLGQQDAAREIVRQGVAGGTRTPNV